MVRIRIGDEEQRLAWDEFEARVRDGRVPEDAMISVPAITGNAFSRAGELELYRSMKSDAATAYRRALERSAPPLAMALLVGFQFRIWWMQAIPDVGAWPVYLAVKRTPWILEDGEAWRIVAMGLTHASFEHVALNLLWMAYVGANVERALGWRNAVTLFFASVTAGAVLSAAFAPYTPSLGSSGGVFGLLGASVVFGLARPDLLPEKWRSVFGFALLPYTVFMFWNGLWHDSTDNFAHGGGLLTGAVLGFLLDPEPVERRPGWNRTVRTAVVALVAVVLALPAIAGPRIEPLVPDDVARARAIRDESGTERKVAAVRPLVWRVPLGWEPGTLSSGELGFTCPDRPRGFSVHVSALPDPVDLDDQADLWLDELRTVFEDVEGGPLGPATVAGRSGVARQVRFRSTVIEWRATSRGVWLLTEVWEVEAPREVRLAPLRDRLRAGVTWGEPDDLRTAREALEQAPLARSTRSRYADALAAAGEPTDALRIWRELVDEGPGDEEAWEDYVRTARWYPTEAGDVRALWDEALAVSGTPRVTTEVARALEASDRTDVARALLDVAWVRHPGDRQIQRARKSRGMGVDLDPVTHQPIGTTTIDPSTPLTVAAAEQIAAERITNPR